MKPPPIAATTIDVGAREYYQAVWGFDPVKDHIPLKKGWARYEQWFSLEGDPDLWAAGIKVGARVDWRGNRISNAIVFRCEGAEARVECTHTVVYAGQNIQAIDSLPSPSPNAVDGTPLTSAILPPEEHFVALKSYLAGLVDVGFATLFRASYKASDFDPESANIGFNSMMQKQIAVALRKVAPWSARAFLQAFLLDLFDSVAPDWITQRLTYLDEIYDISGTLFHDPEGFIIAEEQFPDLPWEQWREMLRVNWDDLKDWATWFLRVRPLFRKNGSSEVLAICAEYPHVDEILRTSSTPELVEKFTLDPSFARTCQKLYHAVIEEGHWGEEFAAQAGREIIFIVFYILSTITCFLACIAIWSIHLVTFIVAAALSTGFLGIFELVRKRRNQLEGRK